MTRLSTEQILKDNKTGDPNSIKSLTLTHKALSDVSCLTDFNNLERLDLSSNNLTSLEVPTIHSFPQHPSNKFTPLSFLGMKFHFFFKFYLKGLRHCVNLKWLSVVQNKLQSLKGIEGLSKLTVSVIPLLCSWYFTFFTLLNGCLWEILVFPWEGFNAYCFWWFGWNLLSVCYYCPLGHLLDLN